MASMDVFNSSAFSMRSLTGAIERVPYVPQLLGSLNMFEDMPVRTRALFVDRRDGELTLIPTSPDGAPPAELENDDRDAVPLRTTRLAKGMTLYAREIEGIRASGSETEMMQVQAEYLRRMARVRQDMELTHEYHRLGALQGKLLDADGTTVIYDYFDAFNVEESPVINFELDTESTNVSDKTKEIARSMARSSKGAITPTTQIHAIAGDAFYDKLVKHPSVEKFYLNQQAAQNLQAAQGQVFESFRVGAITFHNYRGTDDQSTVAVADNEAKFFPIGANGVFKKAMAPAEFGPYINTAGQDSYAINIPDRDRQAYTRGELYSYPLYFTQRPEVLRSGVAA